MLRVAHQELVSVRNAHEEDEEEVNGAAEGSRVGK
jgi:hypothetical protein